MSVMRINFAAPIHKVEFKEVGGKSLAEVSVCKKNRTKDGAEPSYSWLRIAGRPLVDDRQDG